MLPILKKLKLIPSILKQQEKLMCWLDLHYQLYGIAIMVVLFFYDLLINKGIITKIYYVFPLNFIYFLGCKLYALFLVYENTEEVWICTYLYADIVSTDLELIRFSNGIPITIDDINYLLEITIPSKHI